MDESPNSDWERLVAAWQERGYDTSPPKCMAEYADAVIEALEDV